MARIFEDGQIACQSFIIVILSSWKYGRPLKGVGYCSGIAMFCYPSDLVACRECYYSYTLIYNTLMNDLKLDAIYINALDPKLSAIFDWLSIGQIVVLYMTVPKSRRISNFFH